MTGISLGQPVACPSGPTARRERERLRRQGQFGERSDRRSAMRTNALAHGPQREQPPIWVAVPTMGRGTPPVRMP